MTVYVDTAMIPYRRMKMSHMLADTTEELLAMADKIGVQRKWIQNAGTHREHFDICSSKRDKAIEHGAVVVTRSELAGLLNRRREAFANGPVEE